MSDPDQPESKPDQPEKKRTGHVRHDSGGRAIWEWAMESGRHAIDSTSHLLKKLELTGLTLMGDEDKPWETAGQQHPAPEPREAAPPVTAPRNEPEVLDHQPRPKNAGFNPYDTRTPVGRGAPPPKKPVAPAKPRVTQPPAKKRGFFARLFGRR